MWYVGRYHYCREPNAYIVLPVKRIIEHTLKKTVLDGSQIAEYLFNKGLLDLIEQNNLLKGVQDELFQFHEFFPALELKQKKLDKKYIIYI